MRAAPYGNVRPRSSGGPQSRGEFLEQLTNSITDQEMSVVLSSHLASDVELVCDQAMTVAGAVTALLTVTGPQPADFHNTAGRDLIHQLTSTDRALYYLGMATVLLIPAVVGAFWGAPLVARELEAGTHRLAHRGMAIWTAAKAARVAAMAGTVRRMTRPRVTPSRPHLAPATSITVPFTADTPANYGIGSVSQVDIGEPGAWVITEQTLDASGHNATGSRRPTPTATR